MIEVFFRLKESLDKEREEKRDLQKLTEYYFQSLPIMQEQYLSSLVEGKVPEDKIDYFLETYQMQLKSNYYASMAINIEGKRESKLLEQGEALLEEQLRVVSVKQYLDEKLSEKWNFKSFLYLGKVNYILLLEKQTDINSFINSMDRLCKMTEKVLGISILAGIGQVCSQRRLLPDSYKNATLILSYRGVQDESRAIYINELDPHFCSTPVIGMQSVQDIVAEIKVGNKQQLQEAISNFCVKLRNVTISIQQLSVLSMEVYTELYKLSTNYQLDVQLIFGVENPTHIIAEEITTIDDLELLLENVSFQIRDLIHKERKDNTKLLIDRAKTYIQHNFSNCDCTIESVCNYLNISSCYFSTVFKKDTGITLINYLSDIRMEKAKELLSLGKYKVYEVSKLVAYRSEKYFFRIFKQYTGLSPTEFYRNKPIVDGE